MSLNRFLLTLAQNSMEAGIVVLVVFLAQWMFRKHLPPRWQCALWMLVVVRLLLPCSATSPVSVFNLPFLSGWADDGGRVSASAIGTRSPLPAHSFLISEPAPAKPRSSAGLAAAGPSEGVGERLVSWVKSSWRAILFWVWLAGFVVMMARILVTTVRLSRKVSHLQPMTYRTVLDVLDNCRKELGVRARPCIVESQGISSPALHGLFRPRLLLPKGLTVEYSPRELRYVFLHELAHLKRRDLLSNWLVALLQAVHWFNPLVWFGFARWRAAREMACDALALEAAGEGKNQEYGRTVLRLLERFTYRTASPGFVGILEDKRELRQRIEAIAQFTPASRWPVLGMILLVAIAAGCLTDGTNRYSSATVTGDERQPRVLDITRFVKPFRAFGQNVSTFQSISGRQVIDGLPFEVDGQAVIFGQTCVFYRNETFPRSLEGIPIGRRFDELHLLHQTRFADAEGTTIARIRLNYADGTGYEFPILYGGHVRDWLRTPHEEKELLTDPNSKVIWRGESASPQFEYSSTRLFKSVVRNPFPRKVVTSMDVISTARMASYVLVGVTVASRDRGRPVTPAVALKDPQWKFDGQTVLHVVDEQTGKPIEDATVTTFLDGIWGGVFYTPTSGSEVIRYPVGHTGTMYIGVRKEGYVAQDKNWEGRFPDEYTIGLSPKGSPSGDGQPEAPPPS